MAFPDHYREANVAVAPDGSTLDYIGLEEPWPSWPVVPLPPGVESLGTTGYVPVDENLVAVDIGEWGYLVPSDWAP